MANSRILNNKRELSQEEQAKLQQALSKWYPAIIQSYNTPIYDMMASPVKVALIHSAIVLVIILVILALNQKFGFMKEIKSKKLFKNPILYVVLVIILLFVGGLSYFSQFKKNENLTLMLTLTKPGATKYDYESSNVIQSKLLRNSMGRSSTRFGSGVAGGVIGYGLGSSGRRGKGRR